MGILRTDKISGLETPTAVTGSVSFDGTGDSLQNTSSSFWSASDDCTFECFIYPTTYSVGQGIFHTGNQGDFSLLTDGKLRVHPVASHYKDTNGIVPLNTWSHIALVQSSSNQRKVFINGVNQSFSSSGSPDSNGWNNPDGGAFIGDDGVYRNFFNGSMSNVRVLKGTALYTSDFTPPVHALEVIDDTVLLCCNNPDSVTAASNAGIGTAHVLTVTGDAAASSVSPGLARDFTFGTEFKGVTTFDTQGYFVPPSGTTEQRGRGRGVFSVGSGTPASTGSKNIEYVQISSSGNGINFGDLSEGSQSQGAVSSTTRSVISLGDPVPAVQTNILEFITIATTGDAVDFGDMTTKRSRVSGVASPTRGVYIGGTNELVSPYGGSTVSYTDTMDYITIASLGNAISFGETDPAAAHGNAVCNSTRGVVATNFNGSSATNTMEYITIATTGDAKDFGDLTRTETYLFRGCSGSNSTRGIFGGGYNGGIKNIIDYITITSTGNAIDFGDLTLATRNGGTTSNSIRTMFFGGYNASNGGRMNIISYVNIMSTGNAQDFGDCKEKGAEGSGSSDSHGGLS